MQSRLFLSAVASGLLLAGMSAATAQNRNWQGVHIGGHVGGAAGSAASRNMSGYVGGVQIGVNGQFDKLVIGVEADAGATSNSTNSFGGKTKQGVNGSIRARAGYSFGRAMIYGTSGIAASRFEHRAPAGKASTTRSGLVVGAGAELMLTDQISARAEFLHYRFSKTSFDKVGGPAKVQPTNNVIRTGLNYRF